MVIAADDVVLAEPKPHELLPRRQLAPIGLWRITRQGVAGLIAAAFPDQLDPLSHCGPCSPRRGLPGIVILAVFARDLERPQTRRAVAIDDGHERAPLSLIEPATHRPIDEVLSLLDLSLDLVRVDLSRPPVGFVRTNSKE